MPLWMPYADDVALDLSKKKTTTEETTSLPCAQPNPITQLDTSGTAYTQAYSTSPVPAFNPYYQPNQQAYQQPWIPLGASFEIKSDSSSVRVDSTSSSETSALVQAGPSRQGALQLLEGEDPLANDEEYLAFEEAALREMAEQNGGVLLGNNPRMRRAVRSTNQDAANDAYRQQRERNNAAAKQSRDRRKLREIRLALRVAFLQQKVARIDERLKSGVCGHCE